MEGGGNDRDIVLVYKVLREEKRTRATASNRKQPRYAFNGSMYWLLLLSLLLFGFSNSNLNPS